MENRTNDGQRAAEQYLYRYGRLRARVKEWEEEIRELFARKYSLLDRLLRAPQTDREKVRGGKLADPVYETVEKLVDGYDAKIKRAAMRAGYAPQYARRSGQRNLQNPHVRQRLEENGKEKKAEEQEKEVVEYFTKLMRGELFEERVEKNGENGKETVVRQPVKISERTKAAEFLAKYYRVLAGEKDSGQETEGCIRVELKGKLKEWSR
jgi:phage terminase small subunit